MHFFFFRGSQRFDDYRNRILIQIELKQNARQQRTTWVANTRVKKN